MWPIQRTESQRPQSHRYLQRSLTVDRVHSTLRQARSSPYPTLYSIDVKRDYLICSFKSKVAILKVYIYRLYYNYFKCYVCNYYWIRYYFKTFDLFQITWRPLSWIVYYYAVIVWTCDWCFSRKLMWSRNFIRRKNHFRSSNIHKSNKFSRKICFGIHF